MYEAELRELGLSENEARIYIALLRAGAMSPTQVAQHTGMHRSYVYDTIERLLEKGIINSVMVRNKKHYQAVDPRVLVEIFELRLEQLNKIIPHLSRLFQSKAEETRIELHKGSRVYLTMIKDLLAGAKQGDEIYLLGVDEEVLGKVEPFYLKRYLDMIKKRGIKERIIIAAGRAKLKQKNIEYREIEAKYIDSTVTVMHRSKVFIFVLEDPHYLVIIQNEKIANTYRKQFELLWDNIRR